MEFRSFHAELSYANLMFKRIFSNIKIERAKEKGKKQLIKVDCLFSQRSRILKNWENSEKRASLKFPMIVINRTGYQRNPARVNNANNEIKYELTSKRRVYELLTPIPIDVSYEVSIVAKYPSDIDQIVSNFIIFFNNDIFVSTEHFLYEGIKLNNQVVMDDSISEEHADEVDDAEDDLTTATIGFTFKTWFFAGTEQFSKEPSKIVSTYTSSIVSNNIIYLKPNEIDDFQKDHPDIGLSANLTSIVESTLTTLVDNPNLSDTIYNDVPPIYHISCALYPVPMLSNIEEHIHAVENTYPLSSQHYYRDVLTWCVEGAQHIQ